jgi:hypothetical protein
MRTHIYLLLSYIGVYEDTYTCSSMRTDIYLFMSYMRTITNVAVWDTYIPLVEL